MADIFWQAKNSVGSVHTNKMNYCFCILYSDFILFSLKTMMYYKRVGIWAKLYTKLVIIIKYWTLSSTIHLSRTRDLLLATFKYLKRNIIRPQFLWLLTKLDIYVLLWYRSYGLSFPALLDFFSFHFIQVMLKEKFEHRTCKNKCC